MRAWKILLSLFAFALLVAFAFVVIPGRPGSHTRAFLGIVNTLRQIDAAKQQYAIEHMSLPDTVLSREQLLEYLHENSWNPHADYHINAIGVLPEAVLPSRFDNLPAKTIIRIQTNGPGYQIIPPSPEA